MGDITNISLVEGVTEVTAEGSALIAPFVARAEAAALAAETAAGRYYFNENTLRFTRSKLRKLASGGSAQLAIAAGPADSWMTYLAYGIESLRDSLHANFGNAGIGWVGFGFTGTNGASPNPPLGEGVTMAFGGSGWTCNYHSGSISPDLSHAINSTAGAKITIAGPATPVLSGASLFAVTPQTGAIRFRWNGGSWHPYTLTSSSGLIEVWTLAADMPTSGVWSLEIEVVSGTPLLAGVLFESASDGVVIHKLGSSGSRTQEWSGVNAAGWQSGIAAIDIDLFLILLGTNDAAFDIAAATAATNLGTVIDRIRVEKPGVDIMVVMPPENLDGNDIPMPDYSAAFATVAQAKGVCFVDLQGVYGDPDNPEEYGPTGNIQLMKASGNPHPYPDGALLNADTIFRLLTTL